MRRRPAFTLLEVLLATAIGVVLMAALYAAVEIQLRTTQEAREAVERGLLARSLLTRMAADVAPTLAPPAPQPTSSSSAGTGGATAGTNGTGTSATNGSTSSSTPSPSSTATPVAGSAVQVNLGVQGDLNVLTVTVSRATRDLAPNADGVVPVGCDTRRVSYWLVGADSGQPVGLARFEVKAVTSDEAAAYVPPDIPEPLSYVVAEEVKSLEFTYFDGTSWLDVWDSTTPGADGSTPVGPPLAVAIRIGVVPPGRENLPPEQQTLRYYRHVVAIPTANGTTQATTTTTTTTTTTGQ